MSAEAARGLAEQPAPEAVADFLRRMRRGIEDGLDPMSAAERAAGELPERARATRRSARSRRVRGDYHEDEWGFDEQFAEAVYPLFEFLYESGGGCEADGVRNVPVARAGAARLQPRRRRCSRSTRR